MDIRVENHGSIVLLNPGTKRGEQWLRDHTDGMWYDGALVVEPRYVRDVIAGATDDGLEVAA